MILAVAIRQAGVVYTLPRPARHHDVIRLMAERYGLPTPVAGEQGFLDSELGFLDRGQAASRALDSGQVAALRCPPELFSEDLW